MRVVGGVGSIIRHVLPAVVVSALTVACGSTIAGSGNVVTKDVPVTGFSSIEVSSAFDVTASIGATPSVSIRIDDNLEQYLDVGVQGGTLRIGLRTGTSVSGATLQADVTAPTLDRVQASGACRIRVTDQIRGRSIDIELSGASTMEGAVDLESATATLSGASRVSLSGRAPDVSARGSGASRFELFDLQAETLDIDLSGASSAEVSVSDSISASASGGSSLTYHGSPTFTKKEVSGGSSIHTAP
jgi:Putative auto-transporter adhesin, head GIN domain